MVPPKEILATFERLLERNAGRMACPESELPYSRDEIRAAILAEAGASGTLSIERREFLTAALHALARFVPDDEAELVRMHQESESSRTPLPPKLRKRAASILRRIEASYLDGLVGLPEGQRRVLHPNVPIRDLPQTVNTRWRPNHSPSGAWQRHKEMQALGLLTLIPFGAFCIFVSLRFPPPRASQGWRGLGLLLVAWAIFTAVTMMAYWFYTLLRRATSSERAQGIGMVLIVVASLVVQSVLFVLAFDAIYPGRVDWPTFNELVPFLRPGSRGVWIWK